MAQYEFDQIKGAYERARGQGLSIASGSLSDFAREMQQGDSANDWSQGHLPDNWVTGLSRSIDKGFEATGLPDLTGSVGGGFGSLIDSMRGANDQKYESLGRDIGQDIPRMGAGVGLAVAGTALAPVSGGGSLAAYAPAAALIGLGAADAGIKAYSDTGSLGAAGISAATAGLAPGISTIGAKVGLAGLGRVAPTLMENSVARFIAAEIGQEGAFFGANALGVAAQGENPFTPENVFSQAVGTAAFAPLTVARGFQAARVPVAEAPAAVTRKPAAVMGEDQAVTIPQLNNENRLFDYLTGKQDKDIINAFGKNQNVREALRLSGLLDPDIHGADWTSRNEGRKMFNDATTMDRGAAQDQLIQKASQLLMTPETTLADFVNIVAATNKFQAKVEAGNGAKFRKVAAAADGDGSATANNIARGFIENQPVNNGLLLENNPMMFDEYSPHLRQQFKALEFEGPKPTVESVKYDQQMQMPGMKPLSLEPQQVAEPRRPASVKGKVDPNALESRMRRPEYSKILFDEEGNISSKTVDAQYEVNLRLDGDPDRAMARLDSQVRAALLSRMKDSNPSYVVDGLEVAGRALDEYGLSGETKQRWLEVVGNQLKNMNIFEGTRVRTADDMVRSGLMTQADYNTTYGMYFPTMHEIGVSTKNRQATPELAAFNFVKTLGHETFHGLTRAVDENAALGIDDYRIRKMQQLREFADTTSPQEREALIRRVQETLLPPEQVKADKTLNDRLGNLARYAASTADEFNAEMAGLFSMSLAKPRSTADRVKNMLRWAPQAIQDFADVFFRTFDELKSATLATAKHLGFTDGRIQELNLYQENLKALLTPDPMVVKSKQEVHSAMQPFDIINGKKSFFDAKFSKVDSPAMNEAVQQAKDANMFERRFGTLQQLANTMRYKEQLPEFGRVIDRLTTLGADIKKSLNVMRASLLVAGDGGLLHELATVPDSKLTPEQIRTKSNFGRVEGSLENRAKLSEVYLTMNKLVNETNENIGWDHPEIQKLVQGTNPEDGAAIKAVFEAQLAQNEKAAGMIKAGYLDRAYLDMARIYRNAGLSDADSLATGKMLMQHIMANRPVPPELNKVAGTDLAVNFWTTVRPAYEELVSVLNRPHASELRTGRYQVVYQTADGTTGRAPANNAQELKGLKKVLEERGNKVTETIDNQNRDFNEFDAVPTAMAESMLKLERARYESALANLDPEIADRIRNEYSMGQAITEEVNKRKQFLAERKFAPGREFIDMYSNQAAYAEVVAASVTKKTARNRIAWEMESKSWDTAPALRREVEQFSSEILGTRNSSQLTNSIKKGALFVTMGANVSGAMIDSSQPLMVGAWRLAENLGIPGAFKAITEGYLQAFNTKNTEFQALLARAKNDGLLQSGATLNEVITVNDIAGYNVTRAGDRRNLVSLGEALTSREFMAGKVFDMIKGFGGKAFNGVMVPTHLSGQLNNKVMLYAGMVEGKKLGLSGEELYRHATRVSQVTNFQGGRGAQSSFKTKFGQANNWVEVATLLSNYPISVISQLHGSYKDMLKSSGLSPEKRQRAMQVFAGQLTMQFAMAGSLGLGLGSLFKIAETVFGFSPEEEVRKGLTELDSSGNLADILLNGAASAATGVDLSSRFSLSGVAGLNDYTGFDAKGLFGPAVSLWTGVANMPKDFMEGNMQKSMLIPNGVRKMIEATQEGPMKDRAGQTIMDPTTTDRILKFVGFNSKRYADIQDQRAMYRFADDATARENQLKTKERIEQLNQGNFDQVLQSMNEDLTEQVAKWRADGVQPIHIEKMRQQELRSKTMQLVNAAVQKTLPLDPLSEGSAASSSRRQQIAASFGENQVPREVQMQRQELVNRLLTGMGQAAVQRSPKAVRIARLTDQIIQSDPTIPEQQARILAEQMTQ